MSILDNNVINGSHSQKTGHSAALGCELHDAHGSLVTVIGIPAAHPRPAVIVHGDVHAWAGVKAYCWLAEVGQYRECSIWPAQVMAERDG